MRIAVPDKDPIPAPVHRDGAGGDIARRHIGRELKGFHEIRFRIVDLSAAVGAVTDIQTAFSADRIII